MNEIVAKMRTKKFEPRRFIFDCMVYDCVASIHAAILVSHKSKHRGICWIGVTHSELEAPYQSNSAIDNYTTP